MRLLVTRPADDARHTAERLARRGHEPIVAPLIEIRFPEFSLPGAPWQAVLLTSANAVRALAMRKALARLRELPVLAVGEGTAEAARMAGFADTRAAGGTAEDLLALIRETLSARDGPLLHPCGTHLARDLGAALAGDGHAVTALPVYEAAAAATLPAPAVAALRQGTADGALLFSPRSARIFGRLARKAGLAAPAAEIIWFCLSEAVAKEARDAGAARIVTAARPDEAALLAGIDDGVG